MLKTIYPTDEALRKSVYLSIQEISRKYGVSAPIPLEFIALGFPR